MQEEAGLHRPRETSVEIILVHGTWGRLKLGRSPLWFETGSQFITRLNAALQQVGIFAAITPFRWSGANSLESRYHAAQVLASTLRDRQSQAPELQQIVIGHSHGGSVALLAVGRLRADEQKPVLITLATPFIEVQMRQIGARFARAVDGVKSALPVFLLIMMLYLAQETTLPVSNDPQRIPLPNSHSLLWLFGIASAYVLPYLLERATGTAKPEDLRAMTAGGGTLPAGTDMLVLRGLDDEAALVLATGAVGNRLSSAAFLWTTFATYYAAVVLAVPYLLLHFAAGHTEYLRSWHVPLAAIVASPAGVTITVFMIAGCALLPIIAGAFKAAYGRELLLHSFSCQINSHSSPDCERGVKTVSLLPEEDTHLRHGLYNSPSAPAAVADFIRARLACRQARS